MKTIKIINGTYGYRTNGYTVDRKTVDSAPFAVPDDEAERLVSKNVAKIVGEEIVDTVAEKPAAKLPEYREDMKLSELKEIAALYGVNAAKAKSKAEVIALIEDAQSVDEEPPAIDAAMPV